MAEGQPLFEGTPTHDFNQALALVRLLIAARDLLGTADPNNPTTFGVTEADIVDPQTGKVSGGYKAVEAPYGIKVLPSGRAMVI